MKRLLFLILILAVCSLPSMATVAPPTEVSCLRLQVDGEELVRLLPTPVKVAGPGLRLAYVQWGREILLSSVSAGQATPPARGARIIAAAEAGRYEIGRVCYVLVRYCAPGCTGQGCATLRVPSAE